MQSGVAPENFRPALAFLTISLIYITNLDNFKLGGGSWVKDLKLPNGIESLLIRHILGGVFSPKDFKHFHPHLLANLKSLTINETTYSTGNQGDIKKPTEGPEWQLLFPRLGKLNLETTDLFGANFIRHSVFPNLETVSLYLLSDRDNMKIRIDDSTVQPLNPIPSLVELDSYLPYSWSALTALEALIPHSKQLRYIRFIDSLRSILRISSSFVKSLRKALSMLVPLELRLDLVDYHSIWFSLEALDLNLLQSLDISDFAFDGNPLQAHVDMKPVMPTIDLPNLTHLIVGLWDADSCIHFLTHISADLQYLEITIKIHGDISELEDPGNKKDFHMLVEPRVQSLCAILGPDAIGGVVKFPNLLSSKVYLSRTDESRNKSFEEVVLEKQVSELQKRVPEMEYGIRNMLERRSRAGAIRLALKEPIRVEHDRTGAEDVYICRFELLKG